MKIRTLSSFTNMAEAQSIKKEDIIRADKDGYTFEPLYFRDDIETPAEMPFSNDEEKQKKIRFEKSLKQQVYYFD